LISSSLWSPVVLRLAAAYPSCLLSKYVFHASATKRYALTAKAAAQANNEMMTANSQETDSTANLQPPSANFQAFFGKIVNIHKKHTLFMNFFELFLCRKISCSFL